MDDLHFKSLTAHREGSIYDLLTGCYAGGPEYIREWIKSWKEYDQEIFNNPDTVGACGFATCFKDKIIGFASWDPRKYPAGIIGHNCILPAFRHKGYGQYQINEILKRLKQQSFKQAHVSTMDHEFFHAAQKMYLACGFTETGRHAAEGKNYKIITYEKTINAE